MTTKVPILHKKQQIKIKKELQVFIEYFKKNYTLSLKTFTGNICVFMKFLLKYLLRYFTIMKGNKIKHVQRKKCETIILL
jgi:23S rRNA U2552 (ribose-2'-O)-methylase RlmE/FtsJ